MDKEFGSNQLREDTICWDWFSLQLDDGREVMLHLLRSRNGYARYAGATLVDPAGAVRYLRPGEWKLNATGQWTSPATGAPIPLEGPQHPGHRHPYRYQPQARGSGKPQCADPQPVPLGRLRPCRIRERKMHRAGARGAHGVWREQPAADVSLRARRPPIEARDDVPSHGDCRPARVVVLGIDLFESCPEGQGKKCIGVYFCELNELASPTSFPTTKPCDNTASCLRALNGRK